MALISARLCYSMLLLKRFCLSVRSSVRRIRDPRLNSSRYRNTFHTVRRSDVSSFLVNVKFRSPEQGCGQGCRKSPLRGRLRTPGTYYSLIEPVTTWFRPMYSSCRSCYLRHVLSSCPLLEKFGISLKLSFVSVTISHISHRFGVGLSESHKNKDSAQP